MARLCDVIFAAILVFFLTEGTSSSDDLAKEINLFKEVGLGDKPFTGVTSTAGQNDKSTAYHFTTSVSNLIANQKAFEQADKLIHDSHDFIFSAYAKIDASFRYSNPIVSISSKDGHQVFFLLTISGKSQGKGLDITVSVQVNGGLSKTFTANSNRYLDYTKWFKVSVRIQDSQSLLRVFVNDQMVKVESFKYQLITYPKDAELRLAQLYEVNLENTAEITDKFKGALQDVKFMLGSSLDDCPSKATCKCSDVIGTKNCVLDGHKYEDGSRWNKDKCTICQCKWGQVICTHTCQACKDNGQTYLHGETWKSGNDSCQNCKCEEGKTTCSPPPCPKPDCNGKSGKLIIPKGKCCQVCKEDQCLGTGKVYKKCSCATTCSNYLDVLNQGSQCKSCTEGCFCPAGKVLNEDGRCVASVKCPCVYKGEKKKPGDFVISDDGCEYCFCINGRMACNKFC